MRKNYLDALKIARNENEIVLITLAHDIRDLLDKNDIPYIFVIPEKTDTFKSGLIQRCKERGNSAEFIKYISDSFDKLSRDQKDYKCKILICKENQFLEDVLMQEKLIEKPAESSTGSELGLHTKKSHFEFDL